MTWGPAGQSPTCAAPLGSRSAQMIVPRSYHALCARVSVVTLRRTDAGGTEGATASGAEQAARSTTLLCACGSVG